MKDKFLEMIVGKKIDGTNVWIKIELAVKNIEWLNYVYMYYV